MAAAVNIGIVGDRDESIAAHRALPIALDLAAQAQGLSMRYEWLATDAIDDAQRLVPFDALWCVPGSPYRSMDGTLRAIRYARERGMPFLGTCGGFQHAVIEYARHVLGWHDADHAETAEGEGRRLVISALECSRVEASETLRAVPGSRLAEAYGAPTFDEAYSCRFGLNPDFLDALITGPLAVAATGSADSVRALELRRGEHPFYVLTLFQPERMALQGRSPLLVRAFAAAAAQQQIGSRKCY
jgi:CTP synthase (UTP-ammonia lyase)